MDMIGLSKPRVRGEEEMNSWEVRRLNSGVERRGRESEGVALLTSSNLSN